MISYNKIKGTTPVNFNEINFEVLEQRLKVKIDDFTRDCVRQSDHLRKLLAIKPAIFNKATDSTPLEFYKE